MPGQVQLPLDVQLRDDATFSTFFPIDATRPLLETLQRQCEPGGDPLVFLHGAAGTGKSHLLQACCHMRQGRTLYLPLSDLANYPPEEVLQHAERSTAVCLDDLQAATGEVWELALFNLVNRCRQSGARLVVAADAAPRQLAVSLPDLASRLSGGVVFRLPRLCDADKQSILRFRAEHRGLSLPDAVASYIVARAPRELDQLLSLMRELDRASLAEQKALTIPFVKQTLGW